jgi:RNA polymerase sigma factor (sigma-70 family)
MNDQHIDEVALLRGFHSREKYAINKLHGLVIRKYLWLAHKFLKDKEQARDVVNDAFIALLNAQKEFVSIANINAWLYNRIRWNCWKVLRPRAGDDLFITTDEPIEIPDEDPSAEDLRIKMEVINFILQEIESLPDRDKKIIKLYFFEGKTTQEIAALLEMNVKTVHNTRSLLLKSIKNELLRKALMLLIVGFFLPV